MSLAHAHPTAAAPDARIDTLEAAFAVPDARGPLGAPERLLAAVRAELLPALSDVLEHEPYRSAQIALPHVEIDLGTWPEDPPWSEVRAHLAEQLRRLLDPHLVAGTGAPLAEAGRAAEKTAPQLATLHPSHRATGTGAAPDLESMDDLEREAQARWPFLAPATMSSPAETTQAARAHLARQPEDHGPLRDFLAEKPRFAALYGALFAEGPGGSGDAKRDQATQAEPAPGAWAQVSASQRAALAQIAEIERLDGVTQARALVALVRATPDLALTLRAAAADLAGAGPLRRALSVLAAGGAAVDDTGMPRDPVLQSLARHATPGDLAVLTVFLRAAAQPSGPSTFGAGVDKLSLSAARMTVQSVLPSRRARVLAELVARTPELFDGLFLGAEDRADDGRAQVRPLPSLGADIDAARRFLPQSKRPDLPDTAAGADLLATLVSLRGPKQFAALLQMVAGAPGRLAALRAAIVAALKTGSNVPLSPLSRAALGVTASEVAVGALLAPISAQDATAAGLARGGSVRWEALLEALAQRSPALPRLSEALGREDASDQSARAENRSGTLQSGMSRALAVRALGIVEAARMVAEGSNVGAAVDPDAGDGPARAATGDTARDPWLPDPVSDEIRAALSLGTSDLRPSEVQRLWQSDPARVLAALQSVLALPVAQDGPDRQTRAQAVDRVLEGLDRSSARNTGSASPVSPSPVEPLGTPLSASAQEALRAQLGITGSAPLEAALAQVWKDAPQRVLKALSAVETGSVQEILRVLSLSWEEVLRAAVAEPALLRAVWAAHRKPLVEALATLSTVDLKTCVLGLLPASATALRARLKDLEQEAADPALAMRTALIAILDGRALDFEALPSLRSSPEATQTSADADRAAKTPSATPAETPLESLARALLPPTPEGAPIDTRADPGDSPPALALLLEVLAPVEVRAIFDQITQAWPDAYRPGVPLQAGLLAPLLQAPATVSAGSDVVAQVHGAVRALVPDVADRTTVLRLLVVRLGAAPRSVPFGASGDITADRGAFPRLRRIAHEVIRMILAAEAASGNGPTPRAAEPASEVAPPAPPVRDQSEPIAVTEAAGLVLLRPYLGTLFTRLDVVPEEGRLPRAILPRAWAILDALSDTGPEDALKRVLLGLPLDHPAPEPVVALEPEALEMIDGLLRAVIAHWSRLGATSPAGLQQTFLARMGRLSFEETGIQLHVVPGPFDMLLDGLPWSYSPFALPWMAQPIFVKWRGEDA